MRRTRSTCLVLVASLGTSMSLGQTTNGRIIGRHLDAKVTASQCRNQILPLKDQPQSYFDALPQRRLRSLYGLAASCGTVSDLTVQEESDIAGVYALLESTQNTPTSVDPARQAPAKTAELSTECHDLTAKLSEVTAKVDPLEMQGKIAVPDQQQTAWMEQESSRMQQLADWQEQLGKCVVQTPEQLSIKDWQLAIFTYSSLEREFDKISEEFTAIVEKDASKALNEIYKGNDQQWLNDYNSLAHKYNALVRDYNEQRELVIRLSTTSIVFPAPPTFVHCETFVAGSIGTIDCF
jgi:hypothetical protein